MSIVRFLVAAGVDWVRRRWDGGPWSTGDGEIVVPEDEGRHILEIEVADFAGRLMETLSVTVEVSAQGPPPPRVFVTRG